MDDKQRQILLRTAKRTIEALVTGRKPVFVKSDDPVLNANCGCFVTLKTHGELRGCIGQFVSDIPLIQLVREMAISSATGDPRFSGNRLKASELDDLEIEISVLSPLQRTHDPLSLRLGVDGIYIKSGFSSGCFLPQVAEEAGWDKDEFLSYCCSHKAGLKPDAWKDPQTEVYLFTAEVFHTGSEL